MNLYIWSDVLHKKEWEEKLCSYVGKTAAAAEYEGLLDQFCAYRRFIGRLFSEPA